MYKPILCAHCGQPIDDISDCVDAQGKSYHETCFMNCAAGIMLENGLANFRAQVAERHDADCIKLVNLWQKNQNNQEIARLYIRTPLERSDVGIMYHGTIIPFNDCPTCIVPWYICIKDGTSDATMSRILDDNCVSTLIMAHDFSQSLPDDINIKLYFNPLETSLVLGHGEPGCDYDDSIEGFFTSYMTII